MPGAEHHQAPDRHGQPSFGPTGADPRPRHHEQALEHRAPDTRARLQEPRPAKPLSQRLAPLPDERLDQHRPGMGATAAGMSMFIGTDSNERHTANQLRKIPGQFVVDMHGASGDVRIGRSNLGVRDIADVLRANPDWDGKTPITLTSCQTGRTPDGFAARLARELGVPVTAPNTDAWVDYDGNLFASSAQGGPAGDHPGWPPNGEWHTYGPDGQHTVHESPNPPGHHPTWGDDLPATAPESATQRGEVVSELKVLEPNQVSGRSILKDVRDEYVRDYRDTIVKQEKKVAVIRFEAADSETDGWKTKMDASRASAVQKEKNIGALGYQVDHHVLPADTPPSRLKELLAQYNDDDKVSGIIVQMPVGPTMQPLVERIKADKDIDALLHGTKTESPHDACATADGIARVVEPFLADRPAIAVVGSGGFVGRGVVRLLESHGATLMKLDFGDDLRQVRDADIVISVTGSPRVLGPEHIHEGHLLVVDSGFVPQLGSTTVLSDVQHEVSEVPRLVTPVPGGIGPVEMAVLLDRLVHRDVAPDLPPWRVVRR
ncbi:5,10-methylene-tetrahydrofolate dehydrogenase/methenyl tetrahydrofolate cyclohydrolase [Actinokineospora baliensis]|uniref:bifunctional 5,10-methylenetetrahydrofolate dehydrogenase/5,10-methenyltetrahydrofolate cyclohydrolase n=1 Tax=Actinokineospora baliensis TaxID=547056 RepID=UPI00195E7BDC|nr:bifunctional 5,10-methylenetetrahydrofolate dehydrogenase/5,10-methenyltetrahydrofolate cyclohydrolase [Actinokineospora baliensis]MBM7774087.1 5,10-methylene-tetrahydrofolate dehydrogenase/methenyl tetrahydrofolate cyclohydrolase [Actinokineospora baliensis]